MNRTEEHHTSLTKHRTIVALSAASVAGSAVYLHRRHQLHIPEVTDPQALNRHYKRTIAYLEKAGHAFLEGKHRFVGGIMPLKYHREANGQFVLDTRAHFDIENRTIYLTNHNDLVLKRQDGTDRDIDIIEFSTGQHGKREFGHSVKMLYNNAQRQGLPHPHVGVEGAFYPGGKRRHGAWQFVTADVVDDQGRHFLAFDDIKQEVNPKSLEPWTIVLEDGTTFTTLNPYAHLLRYYMRVPSGLKRKDRTSDSIQANREFALQFLIAAQESGVDYWAIHREWNIYIDKFLHKQRKRTKAKALGTNIYWSTVGTAVAHGRGILKPLSKMTTVFRGG